jgi:hypothetical protein
MSQADRLGGNEADLGRWRPGLAVVGLVAIGWLACAQNWVGNARVGTLCFSTMVELRRWMPGILLRTVS